MVSQENEARITKLLSEFQKGLLRAKSAHLKDKRAAAKIAIDAVASFVGAIPRWGDQHFDLIFLDLLTALRDLDVGIVHPMLEKRAFQNRKPASIHRQMLKSHIVYCTDRLHAAGMSVDQACHFVALELQKLGFKFPTRGDTPQKTVRNWRGARSRSRDASDFHAFPNETTNPQPRSLKQLKAVTREGLADALKLLGDVA